MARSSATANCADEKFKKKINIDVSISISQKICSKIVVQSKSKARYKRREYNNI